jgi:hypothetical protein
MNGIALGYERLTQRLAAWAQAQANIRSAIMIGSRAGRTDQPMRGLR